jgi:hypothetical protein
MARRRLEDSLKVKEVEECLYYHDEEALKEELRDLNDELAKPP